MKDETLEWSNTEKDLGVKVDSSLKGSIQCKEAVKKANRALGIIAISIDNKFEDVIIPLYRALVRPHLEYGVQFWCPAYKKDIDLLEKVQRRATRLIIGMKGKDYEDRLKLLKLFSLSRRRIRGDIIQVFKFYKGIDKVEMNELFKFSDYRRTRGHKGKLYKNNCRLDVRKNFFSNRVVDMWNGLPDQLLECNSVNVFKRKLDEWLDDMGVL
jgi:hypothetical protein